jgi:hypothetical protein
MPYSTNVQFIYDLKKVFLVQRVYRINLSPNKFYGPMTGTQSGFIVILY